MTTVKYERALPNNEVFTKQLVEENRQLLVKNREMELRLFRVRDLTKLALSSSYWTLIPSKLPLPVLL